MGVDAFVDSGFAKGDEFALMFLRSSEFTVPILRNLAGPSPSGSKKEELSRSVLDRIKDGEISEEHIIMALALRQRPWLALRIGEPMREPSLKDPTSLLYEFGEETWYGPIQLQPDPIYLRVFRVPHVTQGQNGELRRSSIRWLAWAQYFQDRAAMVYSWSGFTRGVEEQVSNRQFPFWNRLPLEISDLESRLGGDWSDLELHKLILETLWETYLPSNDFTWRHGRLRAESAGVAFNARSSPKDVNIEGLKAFTSTIAKSVLQSIGESGDANQRLAEDAILRCFIHEWGTLSYEFSLSEPGDDDAESEKLLFRGHTYFGLRPNLRNQDSFQHVKTYINTGGARSAADFLLEHMEAK